MAQTKRAVRRIDGEGSIYADGDGFRVALRLPDGRRIRQRAATESEALEKLNVIRARTGVGLPIPSAEHVGPFLTWWLDVQEAKAQSGHKSTLTVDNARWLINRWMIPSVGTKRLRDLEPDDVEAMFAKMVAAGLGRSSLVRARSFLGQALDTALRRGKVARNVARMAELPATARPAERRSLTPAQATALLAAAEGDRLEALYVTGLMLGLRPGELTGLRWDDLDGGTIQVAASRKFHRTGPPGSGRVSQLGDTKTPKSRRTLRVPPPVADALKAHRQRQRHERLLAGPEWVEHGLIFTTETGAPIDPGRLGYHFHKLTDRAGIGRWTPNELRHSAASLMSAAGVPLEVIADVLGHTTTQMLEKHYRHRTRPVIDAHVAVMDSLFGTGSRR